MPRIQELVSFCRIVEQGSFTRAAELLGLSQPAVSLQMKSLEAEYGLRLLHRGEFETTPTESGRIVYEAACQILDLYEKSRQRIQEAAGKLDGKLSVGASTAIGKDVLPVLLGQFRSRYPGISVALRIGDSCEIIDRIVKHKLEVGFVGVSRRDRHLRFETFIQDALILVVGSGHAWVSRSSISPEELLHAPLVLQQQGSGATVALYEALREYDISPHDLNVVMELGLQESAKSAVRSGLGVTIVSRLGVMEELARGVLVAVPVDGIDLRRELYTVYRRTSPLTDLAIRFLDYAGQTVDETMCQVQNGFALGSAERPLTLETTSGLHPISG